MEAGLYRNWQQQQLQRCSCVQNSRHTRLCAKNDFKLGSAMDYSLLCAMTAFAIW